MAFVYHKATSEIFLQFFLSLFLSAAVFRNTFRSLSHVNLDVLYPIPDFSAFQMEVAKPDPDLIPDNKETIFLSINRYERKKNLNLALHSFGMSLRK